MIRELDQELDHKKTFIDSSRALIAPSDAEIDGYESIGMVFGATMLHVLATLTATEALEAMMRTMATTETQSGHAPCSKDVPLEL